MATLYRYCERMFLTINWYDARTSSLSFRSIRKRMFRNGRSFSPTQVRICRARSFSALLDDTTRVDASCPPNDFGRTLLRALSVPDSRSGIATRSSAQVGADSNPVVPKDTSAGCFHLENPFQLNEVLHTNHIEWHLLILLYWLAPIPGEFWFHVPECFSIASPHL